MEPKAFSAFRKKLKKPQKEMAQLLGTSIKAIHSYEQGWRSIPVHVERQLFFLLSRKISGGRKVRPCWDILECPHEKRACCPAGEFSSGDLCWFINGTVCNGTVHGSWRDKMKSCRACEVFKQAMGKAKSK